MRGKRSTSGQGAVEYVGVLAVVGLVVAAVVAATGVPGRVRAAADRAVCAIVGAGAQECAAPVVADGPEAVPEQDAAPPRFQRIAAVTGDDELGDDDYEISDSELDARDWDDYDCADEDGECGWEACPENHLCLYGETGYRDEVARIPVDGPDPDLGLDDEARDRVYSWANNSEYDLCGENRRWFGYRDEVPLASGAYSDGEFANPPGDLRRVDHIGTCDDAEVGPQPLEPDVESNACGSTNLCLYDGEDFTDPIYVFDIGAHNWDSFHDPIEIDLPADVRGRTSSWVNGSHEDLCGVTADGELVPMATEEWYGDDYQFPARRAQDARVDPGVDDAIERIQPCGRPEPEEPNCWPHPPMWECEFVPPEDR
jgi:hypothetical protein